MADELLQVLAEVSAVIDTVESGRERIAALAPLIREYFKEKNWKNQENVEDLKKLLRQALKYEDTWTKANKLYRKDRSSPEDQTLWTERERIRKEIDKKKRIILFEVFDFKSNDKADPDEEPASSIEATASTEAIPSTRSAQTASKELDDSSTSTEAQRASQEPKRPKNQVTNVFPHAEDEIQHKRKIVKRKDPYEMQIYLGDFVPAYKVKSKTQIITEMQKCANNMSRLAALLPKGEYFIDAASGNTDYRWLGLNKNNVENVRFREYKHNDRAYIVIDDDTNDNTD